MAEFVSSRQEIENLIKASYPLIYIVSAEEERVEKDLKKIGNDRNRALIAWSTTEGFTMPEIEDKLAGKALLPPDIKDPFKALEQIEKHEGNAIFVLRDYHPYLTDPSIVRKLRDLCKKLPKTSTVGKKHIILLSSVFKAPVEIEKDIAVVDFDLPDEEKVTQIFDSFLNTLSKGDAKMRRIASLYDEETSEGQERREIIIKSSLGLTENEISFVLMKSLVGREEISIDMILSEKKNIIRKSGILEFYQTQEKFEDIGGLEILKDWLRKRRLAFFDEAKKFGLPLPKGILLIGIPGCGKSLCAKAVGTLWEMPLLRLDVGKVFSSLVGSSEENIRRAIKTAEAVAPSILWLDELEKGFSGTKSSGESDAGTTARVFASFITWLQEKTSPVFVIATANDVSLLPPELLRKGRFDDIFFVDLPNPAERREIFKIHIEKINRRSQKAYQRKLETFDLDKLVASSQNYSGSEIEQAIVSALFDAYEQKKNLTTEHILNSLTEIVPLSHTMRERINEMREWASSRARWASIIEQKDDKEITKLEIE